MFYTKFTFLDINLQAYLLEKLDNLMYMCSIFEFVFQIDQDIIKIGCNKIIKKIKKILLIYC